MSGLVYSFLNVSKADEDYFTFTADKLDIFSTQEDEMIFSRWNLSSDGGIIEEYNGGLFGGATCNGNSLGRGCVRWNAGPACKRSNRDKYELLSGYFDYKFPITVDDNASISISDCMDRCWKNCSCVGIDSRGENYANYTGCILFHGSFTADPSGRSAGLYVIKKQTNPSGLDIKDKSWVWILAAVGTVLIMVLAGILMYLRRRRLRGKIAEGREIAVKRLSRSSGQGLVEFKNELILIASHESCQTPRLLHSRGRENVSVGIHA